MQYYLLLLLSISTPPQISNPPREPPQISNPPKTFNHYYTQSISKNKTLLIWVNKEFLDSEYDDFVNYRAPDVQWDKFKGPGVVICIPRDGQLYAVDFVTQNFRDVRNRALSFRVRQAPIQMPMVTSAGNC